jgi:hypothetical protein
MIQAQRELRRWSKSEHGSLQHYSVAPGFAHEIRNCLQVVSVLLPWMLVCKIPFRRTLALGSPYITQIRNCVQDIFLVIH